MHTRGSILIVEDHDEVRDVICQLIEQSGFGAIGVGSTAAARTVLEKNGKGVVLIISDAVGTHAEGATIEAEARRHRLPLVLMSGHPVKQAEYELAGIDFLPKPFRLAELERRISRALGDE
jgi:DNA-binding NtrC family response regulator